MGVIALKNGDYYVGIFKDGYLDGFVTEVEPNSAVTVEML